jgi:hypothetical protein
VLSARPPWQLVTPPIAVGRDAVLHDAGRTLYATSPSDGTITAIDVRCWRVLRVYDLGADSAPQDVAVASRDHAWVTLAGSSRLVRLDLATGSTTEETDLSAFGDAEGPADLGRMIVDRDRLLVQVRRLDGSAPDGFAAPALLAVVDLATGATIDTDPARDGTQAIALAGTPPRFRMQILRPRRELLVSSTWAFFDRGGIEAIDLGTLRSKGLLVREEDGRVGADLGAFVMVRPDRGYLTFSTDLLLSSHLVQFTRSGEVGPQLHVSLDDFAPALAHDRATDRLFVPEVLGETVGVQVFDAGSGRQLSTVATPTGGPPADLLTLAKRPHARGCAAIDPPISPPGTGDGPPRVAHLPASGMQDG